jgi:hypothetical protein
MVAIEEASDGVQRLALSPAFPHQRLVSVCVLDPRPALHGNIPPLPLRESRCCIDRLNPQPEADIGISKDSPRVLTRQPSRKDATQKATLTQSGDDQKCYVHLCLGLVILAVTIFEGNLGSLQNVDNMLID